MVALAALGLLAGRAAAQDAPPPAVAATPDASSLTPDASAITPPPAPGDVDPASPLAPLPGMSVDWPDLATPDPIATDPKAAVAATDSDSTRERRYRLALAGLDGVDDRVRTLFREVSVLRQGEGKVANVAQIQRRASQDEQSLIDLLHAVGRYDAAAATTVATGADGAITVTLTAEPGDAYAFRTVTLPGLDTAGPKAAALDKAFGVKAGDPVDADKVNNGVIALKAALGNAGFPFAKVADPQVTVDHEAKAATLTLAVDTGGEARFGRILLRGRAPFSADHIATIARFHPNDLYDAALVEDLRRALVQTTLVSAVTITPERSAVPGIVDIAITLSRAPMRTIAGELGYSTGEGIRAELSWQHRNLIKPEGAVTFRGVAGTREQSLSAILRRANFRARDQVLNAQAVASHTDSAAYDAKTFTLGGNIERQTNIIWQKTWTYSYGAELLATNETDTNDAGATRKRTFLIAAVPLNLAYDGSDDLLNPMRGYRLSGRLSPEASLQNGSFTYLRAQVDGSAYVPILANTSLAGRIRLGAIAGAAADRIAPSRRFYAGGGGSVRGYSYQAIGPEDIYGDPVGGRSLTEFSLEARVRFGNFGVVPFLDGGGLHSTTYPKFSGLRYGTGLGVRYYSAFGPIRVDVGTPIARRPGESRIAVYVSLGQAF